MGKARKKLTKIYNLLYRHFGPRHWRPAKSPFEVMVGAILTQNTAWPNVEKAIKNLRKENLLAPQKIARVSSNTLARLVRPSGFYNDKAKKLKNFAAFLMRLSGGDIKKLGKREAGILRKMLLNVNGIGPETADSILLYALGKCVFVVDAYTRRIFSRHALVPASGTYEELKKFFTDNLPENTKLFNEYHALIVETGKDFCKKNAPRCEICPLKVVKRRKSMV